MECDRDAVEKFVKSFDDEEFGIHGDCGFRSYDSFSHWLEAMRVTEVSDSDSWCEVKAFEFLCFDLESGELVGMMNIRPWLIFVLYCNGGNLSLSVKDSFRRKGVASEMIKYAIEFLRSKEVYRLIVTCSEDNIPSKKLINSMGGKELGRLNWNDKPIVRYII